MTARLLPALLVLGGLLALPGAADGQQGRPPVRLTVTPVDVVFPSPSTLDFQAGWVSHGGVTIAVEPLGNRENWQLFLEASAGDMGGYGKPVQDLQVQVEDSGEWISLNTTPTLVAEGSGGATTVTIYYRLYMDWTVDVPGTYSVPLLYHGEAF